MRHADTLGQKGAFGREGIKLICDDLNLIGPRRSRAKLEAKIARAA